MPNVDSVKGLKNFVPLFFLLLSSQGDSRQFLVAYLAGRLLVSGVFFFFGTVA